MGDCFVVGASVASWAIVFIVGDSMAIFQGTVYASLQFKDSAMVILGIVSGVCRLQSRVTS
jgi:hypothetical protein